MARWSLKVWTPDAGSPIETYYVYDATGALAAEYSTDPDPVGGNRYLFADMLGSIRAVTDESGAVRECYDYLPFGRMLSDSDNGRSTLGCHPASPDNTLDSDAAQKFTGQLRDDETRIDYFVARYYSGPQGRFLSADLPLLDQDPTDPSSWNLYGYARNNPLRFVDPTGFQCEDAEDFDRPFCNPLLGLTGLGWTGFQARLGEIADEVIEFFDENVEVGGLREPGDTFTQCMGANASLYSIGGFLDLAFSSVSGIETSVASSGAPGFFTSNFINDLAFGSPTAATVSTELAATNLLALPAMGRPLTHSRRTTTIISLNLFPLASRSPGGRPQVFRTATLRAKDALRRLGRATSFGLSAVSRLGADAAFTGGEALSCLP